MCLFSFNVFTDFYVNIGGCEVFLNVETFLFFRR